MMKKYILILLLIITTFLITACGNKSTFDKIHNNMIKSYNYQVKVDIDSTINSNKRLSTSTLYYDFDNENIGNIKMIIDDDDTYFQIDRENDSFMYYQISTTWYKRSYYVTSAPNIIGTKIDANDFAFLNHNDTEYTLIDETDTLKTYEFIVKLDNYFARDFLGVTNLTAEEQTELLSDFKYIVTIDLKSQLITKIEMDMKDLMVQYMELIGDSTIIENYLVTIEFSKYNEVDVEIPEEALNAS